MELPTSPGPSERDLDGESGGEIRDEVGLQAMLRLGGAQPRSGALARYRSQRGQVSVEPCARRAREDEMTLLDERHDRVLSVVPLRR